MNYTLIAYSIYLPVTIGLTVWVARTLLSNGKVFLVDIFHGQEELAGAVNRLLQVGFYLISLGTAFVRLEIDTQKTYTDANGNYSEVPVATAQKMIEVLSYKVGGFTLILGLMLFFNLLILLMLRSSAKPSVQKKMVIQPE
jgi:hypothetical protein